MLAPPVERELARRLWDQVLIDDPRRFHLILGPRRVGKTTVMYQTVRRLIGAGVPPERLWWLRMDHPILLRESLSDLVGHVVAASEAAPGREVVLLLDELVYADEWDLWLKTFYDERWPVRVIATSSATAALRGRRVESGVGRWREHFLLPYLFSEYLDLVRHPAEVAVEATLAENGILSPNGICAELDGLSQPTCDRYLSYLEQTFLVFRLTNYSGTEAGVQKRGRKLYFHDGAVRNAALQRGTAPLTDPSEMGLLLENLAAGSLHTYALHEGLRLHHWRQAKDEVDLVLDHPTHPIAFEIGSSSRHSPRALAAFVKRYSRFAGRAYLVTPDAPLRSPDQSSDGVGSLPLDLFLVAVGRQAERALRRSLGVADR